MKLALGTVQLGLDYGISNKQGQVDLLAAQQLLSFAYEQGIRFLDTAAAYGNSQQILGEFAHQKSHIITKINPDESSLTDITNALDECFNQLNRTHIYAVMLHNADRLNHPNSRSALKQLEAEKRNGRVQKIGLSLYHPDQVKLFDVFTPDIIQIPLSIIDQRFLANGLLDKLQTQGIEIHVRSAFLQGLLLLEPSKRPSYFKQFSALNRFDKFIESTSASRLSVCLNFFKSLPAIAKIVVGCCSKDELSEIIAAYQAPIALNGLNFACDDQALIVPSNWPKLSN
ncbi:aldo/keto reductase [Pseudoalteromonas ulvae]|uniref:NADP-dependent oxidoreductase domain-containing protein n=1 Tax=Pseudoalteromonas ulvae TaxID=107327 RepID=A0A244CSY9_PSEDV|nr:aldo/keto reductase [Pseudoalteromonas ulvae]OUL58576.1 hypothetical protein B1199_09655 [Pseudoalteromonas ulvae]